jgi:hypothetical protein
MLTIFWTGHPFAQHPFQSIAKDALPRSWLLHDGWVVCQPKLAQQSGAPAQVVALTLHQPPAPLFVPAPPQNPNPRFCLQQPLTVPTGAAHPR